MELSPTSKQMLAIERKKLAGENLKASLQRWQHSMNHMSGSFTILRGKPEQVTAEHLDEWIERVSFILKEMEKLRKKKQPKRKR